MEVVRYLAQRAPASITQPSQSGRLPLQIAAAQDTHHDAAYTIATLLFTPAQLQHRDKSGRSVLQDAVVSKNMRLIHFLLDNGANPNDADSIGRNVIHHGAMIGHLDVLQMLQSRVQLDWDAPDGWDGWTPLMHAARQGHLDTVRFLVETTHADTQRRDKRGRLPRDLGKLSEKRVTF